MSQSIEKIKVSLTDQKLDLLTIAADVEHLSAIPQNNPVAVEGFDPSLDRDAHSVFQCVYTDAREHEAVLNHNIVMNCLHKLKTTQRLITAQDRLQRCSEGFIASDIEACKHDDENLFHTLTANYSEWRGMQERHEKPAPETLKLYSDTRTRIFADYQRHFHQSDEGKHRAAKRYENLHGQQQMAADVWTLRVDYMSAALHENALTIDGMGKKLVQIATVRTAITEGIIGGNALTDEIIATNLKYCYDKLAQSTALRAGAERVFSQIQSACMAGTYGPEGTPASYRALKMGMIPAITP